MYVRKSEKYSSFVLMFFLFFGLTQFMVVVQPAEAQILKKIKHSIQQHKKEVKEAKKLLDDVIKCVTTDSKCIERAHAKGKKVVLTDKNGSVLKDEQGNPVTAEEPKNAFASATKIENYGKLVSPQYQYALSLNAEHAAFPGIQGSRNVVYVDGKPDDTFDDILFDTFTFNYTGKHYAYVARKGTGCIIIEDGKQIDTINCEQGNVANAQLSVPFGEGGAPFNNTSAHAVRPLFQFNRLGTVLAYLKNIGQKAIGQRKWKVVINGHAGPAVSMGYNSLFFIRGEKVFYIATCPSENTKRMQKKCVYINNKPGPAYDGVRTLIANNDGKHYAYIASNNIKNSNQKRERVIIDGEPQPIYRQIASLYIDGNTGKTFYDAVTTPGKRVPGKPLKESSDLLIFDNYTYKSMDVGPIISLSDYNTLTARMMLTAGYTKTIKMSRDGNRHAFVASVGNTTSGSAYVWSNGTKSQSYAKIKDMMFTNDNSRLIFIAENGDKDFVVIEGKELGPFDRAEHLKVSKKGNSYAFMATNNRQKRWYVNGKAVGPDDNRGLEDLIFSDDGTHYAFGGAYNYRENFIVIDGEIHNQAISSSPVGERQSSSHASNFVFSRDGHHVVYDIRSEKPGYEDLIYDGKQLMSSLNAGCKFAMFSEDSQHLAFLCRTNKHTNLPTYQLYIDGKPGPVVGSLIPKPTAGRKFTVNPNSISFKNNHTIRTIGFIDDEIIKQTITL